MKHTNDSLSYEIQLHTTDNAVKFVKAMNTLEGYYDLCIGSYSFDAKSLLGVLSLDPRRILTLHVVRGEEPLEKFHKVIEPFCVKSRLAMA